MVRKKGRMFAPKRFRMQLMLFSFEKGMRLLENGCMFSEFGTRRRRSYRTFQPFLSCEPFTDNDRHTRASAQRPHTGPGEVCAARGNQREIDGDQQCPLRSSVRFLEIPSTVIINSCRFNVLPIGTVAHEWFMGIAAVTKSYTNANEIGLREWVACFGAGT